MFWCRLSKLLKPFPRCIILNALKKPLIFNFKDFLRKKLIIIKLPASMQMKLFFLNFFFFFFLNCYGCHAFFPMKKSYLFKNDLSLLIYSNNCKNPQLILHKRWNVIEKRNKKKIITEIFKGMHFMNFSWRGCYLFFFLLLISVHFPLLMI